MYLRCGRENKTRGMSPICDANFPGFMNDQLQVSLRGYKVLSPLTAGESNEFMYTGLVFGFRILLHFILRL